MFRRSERLRTPKRPAEEYAGSNKRRKTKVQVGDDFIHGSEIVAFENSTYKIVAYASLINVREFATPQFEQLEYYRPLGNMKVFTCFLNEKNDSQIKRWAHWLQCRDVGAVLGGDDSSEEIIFESFSYAEEFGDTDYRDAILDFAISWIKAADGVEMRAQRVCSLAENHMFTEDVDMRTLLERLVLHHAPQYALDIKPRSNSLLRAVFNHLIAARKYPDAFPADPLTFDPATLCHYHLHRVGKKPCYRTKSLPKNPL